MFVQRRSVIFVWPSYVVKHGGVDFEVWFCFVLEVCGWIYVENKGSPAAAAIWEIHALWKPRTLFKKNTKKPTLTTLSPLTHSLRSILVDDGVLIMFQLLRIQPEFEAEVTYWRLLEVWAPAGKDGSVRTPAAFCPKISLPSTCVPFSVGMVLVCIKSG